jgi:hypothetical protein
MNKAKMQDMATRIAEKAVVAHESMSMTIATATWSVCAVMAVIGLHTLSEALESAEVSAWMYVVATVGYSLVVLYWFVRLILRLGSGAVVADKRARNAHRQAEVNR